MKGPIASLVIGVLAFGIALVMFPVILDGTHDLATDAIAGETHTSVVDSGTPNYTADVVLVKPLYQDSLTYFTSVASGTTTETPAAASYVASTQTVTISGLNAGSASAAGAGTGTASRTLTIAYENNALTDFNGMDSVVHIAPLVVFIGLILFGGGATVYGTVGVYRSKSKIQGRSPIPR